MPLRLFLPLGGSLLLWPAAAHAATGEGSTGFVALFLQSMASLAAVLALFAAVIWVMRRLKIVPQSNIGSGERLHVVQRLALGGKHSLAVVAYGDKRWLVGMSPTAINCLSPLGDEQAAGKPETEVES